MNEEHTIAVVHNGIIENYEKLKQRLEKKGYRFVSETDTEVLAHMLTEYYRGDRSKRLKGHAPRRGVMLSVSCF